MSRIQGRRKQDEKFVDIEGESTISENYQPTVRDKKPSLISQGNNPISQKSHKS